MDFRIATLSDRHQVEELWAYCFEPPDHPFFRWYFDAWDPADTLCGWENGKLQACVHLNPYTLQIRGQSLPVPYIVGLATAPQARRGGVAGKLLYAALEEMRRRGCYFNILMPSKAGFYYPYGWELCYHQIKYHIHLDELRRLTAGDGIFEMVNDSREWSKLAAIYESFTSHRHGFALRRQREWERLLGSHQAENGRIALLFQDNRPTGYMLYHIRDGLFTIGDMAYTTAQAQRNLLGFMYNHRSQATHGVWNSPFDDTLHMALANPKEGVSLFPFMSGRIVDVASALSAITYPAAIRSSLTISVADSLVDWNQGVLTLEVTDGRGEMKAAPGSEPSLSLTINALSQLVFGRLSAAELVRSGQLTAAKPESLKILDSMFPKCENYINEYF